VGRLKIYSIIARQSSEIDGLVGASGPADTGVDSTVTTAS
jgi:hypothetical protein